MLATIQAAVTAANAGDQILADAGTYDETVTVDKSLVIQGAQNGVDARTRATLPADESIVTGAGGGFILAADNVEIDGFTIQGADAAAGITGSASVAGESILNNIIQNNTIGIILDTSGNGALSTVNYQPDLEQHPHDLKRRPTASGIYSDGGAQQGRSSSTPTSSPAIPPPRPRSPRPRMHDSQDSIIFDEQSGDQRPGRRG